MSSRRSSSSSTSFLDVDFEKFKLVFNTKNKLRNSYIELPLTYKRHPIGNNGFLHRSSTFEKDFQYYVVEVFIMPENPGKDYIFKNISLVNTTLKEDIVYDYSRADIANIFRFFTSITNSFLGTGNASREKYTTSGTFEASGGSRIDYRSSPQWGIYGTSSTAGAYTTIDFAEGTCLGGG
jgi:hypothetical protein